MTENRPTAAQPIESPGTPAPPLDVLLDIDNQPEVAARLAADMAAIRDAERRADAFSVRARELSERGWET